MVVDAPGPTASGYERRARRGCRTASWRPATQPLTVAATDTAATTRHQGGPMRIKATSLCAAVAALLLLAAAPVASAGGRLAGGTTTLSLDPAAVSALGSLGVGVTPIGPAKANGGGIAFPITGGDIHPSTAIGRIQHSGGLRLSAGGKRLDVTRFNVRIAGEAFLTANVGGARVKLLTLDTSKAKVGRKGFDTTVSGVGVALTGT